jgi:uncharacterized RmlC-like cupin family protein
MVATKYGKYVRPLVFDGAGPGFYRQVTSLSSESLGVDAVIEFGTYIAAGRMDGEPYGIHTHDFNQALLFLGADTNDIGALGAEVELCLGEEGEKHMITTSTAISVPRGFPHFPANITRLEKRFIFMTVSCSSEYNVIPFSSEEDPLKNPPVMSFMSKHRSHIINLPFTRKGAWSYGPTNTDDSGGHLAFINGRDPGFDFLIMCESIKKAPYRFGPNPETPHVHPKPEILFFIGTNTEDLTDLGGEAEISIGDEKEIHVFDKSTAIVLPGGVPHCPLTITKVDRPFYLTDVRPYGNPPPTISMS